MGHQDTTPGQPSEEHIRVTHSMDFMAYLHLRGLDFVRFALEQRKTGKVYCFYYLDPDDSTEQLHTDYLNSECHRFDAIMKTLRDMTGSKRPSRRQRRNPTRGRGGKARDGNGHNQRHHSHSR